MSDTTKTNIGAGRASTPLTENEHVKELLSVLRDNGKDSSGLTALINHVGEMENFVKLAEHRIADMKIQLDAMKETQEHPIRHTLQATIKALELKVSEIKEQISGLKDSIIEGCKNAVETFKEKGAAVLDKLALFFKVKNSLQSIIKNIDASIKLDNKAIEKITSFAKEYHSTGQHLKNMGRVLSGKPPIDSVKESGKLAKTISAPYKADKAGLLKLKAAVTGMIGVLERLEQKTAAKHAEKKANPAAKKPSLAEKLKANKELIKQKDLDKPTPKRAKAPGLEV